MTAQRQDRLVYQGMSYTLLAAEGAPLFDPRTIGIAPQSFPGCARGYHCLYAVTAGMLSLSTLTLGDQSVRGPVPAGVTVAVLEGSDISDRSDRSDRSNSAPWPLPAHLPLLGRDGVAYPDRHILRWSWLRLPIPFTGRMLLGRGPVAGPAAPPSEAPGANYRSRMELDLEGGRVLGQVVGRVAGRVAGQRARPES
jgi:hypothetical protein